MTEILLRPNRAVLHFHGEDTGEEGQQEHRESDDREQRNLSAAMVVSDVPVKIHQGTEESDDDQGEQYTVEYRNELRVILVTLLRHARRPSCGPFGDYSRNREPACKLVEESRGESRKDTYARRYASNSR